MTLGRQSQRISGISTIHVPSLPSHKFPLFTEFWAPVERAIEQVTSLSNLLMRCMTYHHELQHWQAGAHTCMKLGAFTAELEFIVH